jgi:hypothetical protein
MASMPSLPGILYRKLEQLLVFYLSFPGIQVMPQSHDPIFHPI